MSNNEKISPEIDDSTRKYAVLLEIGALYDEALKLVELAFTASHKANQDASQQQEIFREAARRGSAALSSVKSVCSMVGEAILATAAEAEKLRKENDA